jgi:hypothetical protein
LLATQVRFAHVLCSQGDKLLFFIQVGETFGLSDFYPCSKFGIHLLQFPANQTVLDDLDERLSSLILKVVKMSIKMLSIEPVDIGAERHLSDSVIEQVFEDYFSDRNARTLQSIRDVNPVYVRAKERLMQLSNKKQLTQSKFF